MKTILFLIAFLCLSLLRAPIPPPAAPSCSTDHCGGFILNAPHCCEGHYCQLDLQCPDCGGTCQKCASPCVNCISSSSSCLTCITGYTILGTQCVSNYNFGATVVFATNPTSFVQNYYNLLANISTTVGQQINTIAVISIQYGSATVNFIVSTTNA